MEFIVDSDGEVKSVSVLTYSSLYCLPSVELHASSVVRILDKQRNLIGSLENPLKTFFQNRIFYGLGL